MNSSIIIADDHPLVLKGLKDFLLEKKYNVIDSAVDGKEAYNLIIKHKPDIAILDIKMPFKTGIEIAEECNAKNVKTKIVLITFEKDINLYKKAKELNVFGYVLKEFALTEIENCISSVQNNTPYFSPELIDYLAPNKPPESINDLTNAEKRVLSFIAQNKTAKEIGDILSISSRTVEKHKSHIIRKLNLEPKHSSLSLFAKEYEIYLI